MQKLCGTAAGRAAKRGFAPFRYSAGGRGLANGIGFFYILIKRLISS